MRFGWTKAAAAALTLACAPALAACGDRGAALPYEQASAEATAWLEKNKSEEGVVTLPSGLQYKIVRSGPAGGAKPDVQDEVKVHYHGTLTDGTVFDSSYDAGAPAVFRIQGLIPAWEQALPMMKPGDEWILYVPPQLGYGETGSGPIPPNSVLVFRIELLDVLPQQGGSLGRG